MEDLIKALQIFVKYGNPYAPCVCAHDKLVIVGIDPGNVTAADKAALEALDFFESEEGENFYSFRFGSA